MDRNKTLKQSSITSFFSQRSTSASQANSASGRAPAEASQNSITSSQSSLGGLPERKRPSYEPQPMRPAAQDLFSRPPPASPYEPSSSAVSTVAIDAPPISSQPLSSNVVVDPASSISLGFLDKADLDGSFPPSSRPPAPASSTSPSPRPGDRIADHSGWSSPARPSTPSHPLSPKGPASDGVRTPTRTLFGQNDEGSTASKRTAMVAAFSPLKARPPSKIAKISPTPSLRSSNKASPFSSTPQIPSSPTSPVAKKPAFNRDTEIMGSDDDDDMSDCSLPEIDAFVPSKPQIPEVPLSAQLGATTPEGKKKWKSSLNSPLPLHNRAHKFDMKTLMAHQRTDDAIAAGFKKATEYIASPAGKTGPGDKSVLMHSPNTIRQQFISIAGVKEETAGKALRAMERTESANSEQTSFYFFKASHDSSGEKAKPFPKAAAQGPWALLLKDGTRRHHIKSGFFSKLAGQYPIPDDIYLWLLDSMRLETSPVVRTAYCELLSASSTAQVKRLVNAETLQGICRGLGAIDGIDDEQLRAVQERERAYQDRDWGGVLTHLEWLAETAPHFRHEVIQHAVMYLLRMAADRVLVCNPDLLFHHQAALVELVEHVPPASWDTFCEQAAVSLYGAFGIDSLRVKPLQCAPATSSRIRELRRRLARAFFLGDPSLARQHPDRESLLSEIIDRLGHNDFKISRKTDYVGLRARMQMLDIAIDDGSFARGEGDAEKEKRFNENIDEVARRLRDIWSSINDAGALYLSRTQTKSTIDCMQKRITYSERTKAIPKQSLFDMPNKQSEEPSTKSKAFMQKFIGNLKKPKPPGGAGKTPQRSEGGSSDAEETFVTAVGD